MNAQTACLNCDTPISGAFCHGCGQRAGEAHRSMLHLGGEFLETFSHADSRFWRTMRRLALDPARLTRDYLAGRRAYEIPPLRLFFVMMFLLFTIGSLTTGRIDLLRLNPAEHHAIVDKLDGLVIPGFPRTSGWLRDRVERAVDNPGDVVAVMREWLERFAFLMLPIAGLMLWVLYWPQRRFTLYDHMNVSIHSLSFASLVLIAMFLLGAVSFRLNGLLLLLLPLHLFAHMRGVYRSGIAGTLFRMAMLAIFTLVAMLGLLAGLAAIGLEFGAGG